MLWHELERTGVRLGLKEIDERLTFSAAKACYLNWVKHLGEAEDTLSITVKTDRICKNT